MSFNVHVISDLNYGYNEPTQPEDLIIPDSTDLVIFNGNLGVAKRSILYAFELVAKYPDIQFVWNPGEIERYWRMMPKYEWEFEDNMAIRTQINDSWPKNLHWKDPRTDEGLLITLRTGQTVDVFPIYGFMKIHSVKGDWEDTHWYSRYSVQNEYLHNLHKWPGKVKEAEYATYGIVPIWFTPEYMNMRFAEMEKRVKKWELNLKHYGILVTHVNPYNDPRNENCAVSPYLIHLNNGLWVASNNPVENINFLGAKLYSNPGRGELARSKIITVD